MSESADEPDETEISTGPTIERNIDVEGRKKGEEVYQQERREQIAENAEGESTRERLLAAKRRREKEAPPFEHTFTEPQDDDLDFEELFVGETFEFKPFPKELKNMVEEAVLKFAGLDEDELPPEEARRMDEVNEAILQGLIEHSTDAGLNRAWWKEMTDMEDRQVIAGQLIEAQGK